MSYRIAGIDVHKKMIVVVIADGAADSGGVDDTTRSPGGRYGIDGTVLEAGVGSVGAVLDAGVQEEGRSRSDVGDLASGAGQVQPRAQGTEERFCRCATSGEALGSARAGSEFRSAAGTAFVADGNAQEVSINAPGGAGQEPTGSLFGGDAH